ncbi:hypothetical protein cje139_05146, partial [Campylobacter jejuni subsp. jejuni LMG 9081]
YLINFIIILEEHNYKIVKIYIFENINQGEV